MTIVVPVEYLSTYTRYATEADALRALTKNGSGKYVMIDFEVTPAYQVKHDPSIIRCDIAERDFIK